MQLAPAHRPGHSEAVDRRPLRILMVMHLPPIRELGGARVQLELAEHLRAQSHHVDLLTHDDVFGGRAFSGPLRRRFPPRFAARSVRVLRTLAKRYDIIDAQQGNVPVDKEAIAFDGLLVARSVGLVPIYQDYLVREQLLFPDAYHGSAPGRVVRALRRGWDLRDALKSYDRADLVNVPNHDERMWLDQHVAGDRKTVVLPYGLSQSRRDEFDAMGRRAGIRLAAQEITFIGTWSLRKGAADWPEIWSQIRHERPAARLRLLGVGNRSVLHDAEVIGGYKSDELPSLLSHGTVGAFPSYVEGFPFAVLEQLAAGIPVVAYDSPGARETLRQLEPSLLVPPGDTERLARRILDILALDGNDYALLAEACRTLADQYLWPDIASQTADIYRSELARIRNR